LAQAAVNRVRHTSLRIRQILDGKRSGTTAVWKPAVGFAATAAMACLLIVGEMPKLIGFASPTSAVTAAAPMVAQSFVPARAAQSLLKRSAIAIAPSRPKLARRPVSEPAAQAMANTEVGTNQPEDVRALPAAMEEVLQPPSLAAYRTIAFTAEETVFVVMQDQQFTAAGDKVVRFSVYRLTVFYPEFYPSNSQKPLNKSI
jgi:hypothetical protein